MNVENKQSAIQGMNEMFYYAMNIPYVQITYRNFGGGEHTKWVPTFIKEVPWNCNMLHMVEKWESCIEKCGAFGEFMYFYSLLDNENRRLLLEYILDNYTSGSKI